MTDKIFHNMQFSNFQNALQSSHKDFENLYEALFENYPHPAWIFDIEKRKIAAVNQAAINVYGYSENEFLDINISRINPFGEISESQKDADEASDKIEQHQTKDGLIFNVKVNSYSFHSDERPMQLVLVREMSKPCKNGETVYSDKDLLNSLMDSIPDTIYFKDTASRFIKVNQAQAETLGFSDNKDVIGKTDFEFFPFEQAQEAFEDEQNLIISRKPVIGKVEKIALPDGTFRWVTATKVPMMNPQGEVIGIAGISRDISEQKRSEEQFRVLFENNPQPSFIYDLETLEFLAINEAAVRQYGYSREEFLSTITAKEIRPAEDVSIFLEKISKVTAARDIILAPAKHKRKDGTVFDVEITSHVLDFAGKRAEIVHVNDVTERKALENQLTHQALHDSLTNLANRVLFLNRVEHALSRVNRQKKPLAVLFLDLDNFKTINDSFGHFAGDQLLVSVAERLQTCLRTSDTAARLGGDEFAVLIEDAEQAEDAVLVAERLLEVLKPSFKIEGKDIFVGTSVGIAVVTDGNVSSDEILRNADVAMYMAKSKGKDCYVVYEDVMHETLIKRVELETDLRQAIENEEFTLHYQPIVDLKTECVTGMEALVRWNHPTRGLIPPLEFIPITEETGLIIPLGKWIMETACKQANIWQKQFFKGKQFTLTVNLSSSQFEHQSLIETVEQSLAKSGLPPHCLVLEITENMMLQNIEATNSKLKQLKELGIRLAIDDFGTGYSSLSYLQRFPVDILKIDKSFIDKISFSKEGAAVARAIIMMSETLHLKTVAEGIERSEQIHHLKNMGCEHGQGFHFAKPLPDSEMEQFLSQKKTVDEFQGVSGLMDLNSANELFLL